LFGAAAHDGNLAGGVFAGAEFGHRAQVVELELGRAFGADAEEGFVEFRLDGALCFLGDPLADRFALGCEVPDDLAVFLDEVGVALGVVDDYVDRAGLVADAELGGGFCECGLGLGRGELADAGELEQPLGRRTWPRRRAVAVAAARRRRG